MVDFKKLLSECRKQLNDPERLEDMRFCHLPKGHDGECKGDSVV